LEQLEDLEIMQALDSEKVDPRDLTVLKVLNIANRASKLIREVRESACKNFQGRQEMADALVEMCKLLKRICKMTHEHFKLAQKCQDADLMVEAYVLSLVRIEKLLKAILEDSKSWSLKSFQNGTYYFEKVRLSLALGKFERLVKFFKEHAFEIAGGACVVLGGIGIGAAILRPEDVPAFVGVAGFLFLIGGVILILEGREAIKANEEPVQINSDQWDAILQKCRDSWEKEYAESDEKENLAPARQKEIECAACWRDGQNEKMVILAPCGHHACLECRNQMSRCMTCRVPIESHVAKVYDS